MRFPEHTTLRTNRLHLRPLREEDAVDLYQIFSEPEVMRYWSGPPWESIDQAHSMISHDAISMASGDHLRLGIELVATQKLIGTCTLFSINESCRRAEVGYGLHPTEWGNGYMIEALVALVGYGFQHLNLNRIEADIDPRNAASARTLGRLGFVKEGLLRERWIVGGQVSDTVYYGLLRSDWEAARTLDV